MRGHNLKTLCGCAFDHLWWPQLWLNPRGPIFAAPAAAHALTLFYGEPPPTPPSFQALSIYVNPDAPKGGTLKAIRLRQASIS